jgi:hypothetical protein
MLGASWFSTVRADDGLRPFTETGMVSVTVDFHVAQGQGDEGPRPVVDRRFIEATVKRASEIWAPVKINFRLGTVHLIPPGKHVHMWNRWMRSALVRALPPGDRPVVDVFVVKTVADLSRSWVSLPGVQWFSSWIPGGRYYVILGARSVGEETLAHELGHYFGLDHSRSRVNIMTPGAARTDARLSGWQIRRAQQRLAYFLEKGMLRRHTEPAPAVGSAGVAVASGDSRPAAALDAAPGVLLFTAPSEPSSVPRLPAAAGR